MATQNILSRIPKGTMPGLFSLTLSSLCAGPLEQAAFHFNGLLCALAGEIFKHLPPILVEAARWLGGYAMDHMQFFTSVESLISLCSALRLLAGVVFPQAN